jgi:hypothetical protein
MNCSARRPVAQAGAMQGCLRRNRMSFAQQRRRSVWLPQPSLGDWLVTTHERESRYGQVRQGSSRTSAKALEIDKSKPGTLMARPRFPVLSWRACRRNPTEPGWKMMLSFSDAAGQ